MKPLFEAVHLDDKSIRVLHYQCQAFQDEHSWHYHPEYELSYIVRGEGTRFLGDSVDVYHAGDLVFLGPDIPHCWTSNAGHREGPCEMIVVQFRAECLGEGFLQIPEAQSLRSLLTNARRGIHYTGRGVEVIRRLMERLIDADGLYRIAVFIELLHGLGEEKNGELLMDETHMIDDDSFQEDRMSRVINHVISHLSSDIRQTEVADLLGMTPQGFSRFFKATTGRTFVSFVNRMRITEACRLLASTRDDILTISLQCGYSNLSNFNRRFSALKGTTPSQYRRQRLSTEEFYSETHS